MRFEHEILQFDNKRRMHITKLKIFDKVKVVGHTLVQQLEFNFTTHYQHICITQNGTRIIKKPGYILSLQLYMSVILKAQSLARSW